MKTPRFHVLLSALVCLILLSCSQGSQTTMKAPSQTQDPSNALVNPPASPVKLIFIHHSTGGMWLANNSGGLGKALMENNYYVSATNYGWGPNGIGDRTDIINWPEWFTGDKRDTYMNALFNENGQNIGDYGKWSRLRNDPGGENQIIVFKSCLPQFRYVGLLLMILQQMKSTTSSRLAMPRLFISTCSHISPPARINSSSSSPLHLWRRVIITPVIRQLPSARSNIRVFNNWLINDWLVDYPYSNVAVFDYYNVLTSNGSQNRIDLTDYE